MHFTYLVPIPSLPNSGYNFPEIANMLFSPLWEGWEKWGCYGDVTGKASSQQEFMVSDISRARKCVCLCRVLDYICLKMEKEEPE